MMTPMADAASAIGAKYLSRSFAAVVHLADTGSMSVEFSGSDRQQLAQAMKDTSDARLFRRLQAVLRITEGRSVTEAARQAGVDRASVSRWVAAYSKHHAVEDRSDRR